MSVKSSGSHDGPLPSTGSILRSAVLKKMKTSRKKYFVLRAETPDTLARLEYYDSEKKFRAGLPPKKCIPLKTCFNINRKQDSKHKNVIALYTKDECFCIVFDGEEDLKVWLKDLLTLQHGEEIPEGEILKPKFEYVWQVTLCERGLGAGRTGLYRLCLTDKTITLVKIDEAIPTVIELSLTNVRSCGNLKNFFVLEVGRMSEIGAGEIWFEADDSYIALNIQTTVTHRFKRAREKSTVAAINESADLQPTVRNRSASATESSKSNTKKFNPIMSSKSILPQDSSASESTLTPSVTSTSSSTVTVSGVAMSIYNHILQRSSGKRRHSISGGGTSWAAGANHQRTQSLPVATPVPATAPPTNSTTDNPTTICLTNHQPASATKKGQSAAGGGKCSFRERCDSMPSRPRTTSEGNHGVPSWGKPYLVPNRTHHLREASHSPPTGSPISPPSDSTGSSYSLPDEHDGVHELEHQRMYSTLTPEQVIAEEDYPESPRANPPGGNYVPLNFQATPEGNYTEMTPGGQYGGNNYPSNSASMSSVTSGTPSTDIRLSEYPLDKVFSYVCADDDDTRQCRAYSVGSKPPEAPLSSTPENARVRAFSVGSKTKKYFNRVLPSHQHLPGLKSNSAPLLAPYPRMGSSHGSINNPMDDLMEMDFSSNDTSRSRTSTNASGSSDARSSCNHKNSSCNGTKGKFFGFLEHFGVTLGGDHKKNATPDGYVEMKPGPRTISSSSDATPYVDMTQGQRITFDASTGNNVLPVGHASSPYLDMSGNNVPSVGHANSPYLDMSGNNVPPVGHASSPYLDMSGNNVPSVGHASSPYLDLSGSNVPPVGHSPYLDMSGNNAASNVPLVGHPYSPYLNMSGNNGSNIPPVGNENSPYMDMSGGSNAVTRENYMDMSGSSPLKNSPKLPAMSLTDYVKQFGRNPLGHENYRHDYIDMNQRHRANSNSSANSRGATSPGAWFSDHNSDYFDMSGRNSASRRSERTSSFGSHMSSSPHFDTASPKEHAPFGVQSGILEGSARDKEGYVEMTPGDFTNIGQPIRHQRQSSTDSTDNEHGDYLNMSGMNASLNATKPDKKGRSQPIAIQTASGNTILKNSSPISISSLLGRKSSPPPIGSPKMHLPLSPYSSLPRQKSSRKSSSQAGSSMDSSVSSSVTTTPSSSSTMFPMSLNSPTSPLGVPSKTAIPTTSAMKVPASVLNVPYKSGAIKKKGTISDDYTMMDFETNKPSPLEASNADDSPYMNYCPSGATSRVPRAHGMDEDDYAVMKPGIFPTKPTTLPRMNKSAGSTSGLASPLANHLSSVGLSDRQSVCFMPIREKDERMCSPKPGDVPDKSTHDYRTLETANMEFEDDSSQSYERLKSSSGLVSPAAKISRPNSSSDNIKTVGIQRPASTSGSEKNGSRPSSVCSGGSASRLGSTSSVYSSASSASTVVGVCTKPDQPQTDQPQQQIVRLHYASLDLSASDSADDRRSPRMIKNASSEASLSDSQPTTTFVYADIDFVRSEELSKGQRESAGLSSSNSGSGSSAAVKN